MADRILHLRTTGRRLSSRSTAGVEESCALIVTSDSFSWGWDAVTAIANVILVLGVVLAALSLLQERRRDREQREQALLLQADAARRDMATLIMIDAYRIIVAAPFASDDTWLKKLETPLSMLQLIMDDEGIRTAIKAINDLGDSSKEGRPSLDVEPALMLLRDRIRENLGIAETTIGFSYLRTSVPSSRCQKELGKLWQAMTAEIAGDGDSEATRKRMREALAAVELQGSSRECEIVKKVASEWATVDASGRSRLAAELRSWIRQTFRVY
jgi:hypothetical protein